MTKAELRKHAKEFRRETLKAEKQRELAKAKFYVAAAARFDELARVAR